MIGNLQLLFKFKINRKFKLYVLIFHRSLSTVPLIGVNQELLLEEAIGSITSTAPSVTNAQATSPIKKPIGAERTINTTRSTSSISPPLLQSSTPPPLHTLVQPIRPASTVDVSTPAKPINIQISSSKNSLSAQKSAQIVLPLLASSETNSSLSPSNEHKIAYKSMDASTLSTQQSKQMIRVPPQQKLINQASPQQQQQQQQHSPSLIAQQQQADQLNKLKQIQQQQQQQQQQQLSQQQAIVNNLIMLLSSNNSNIDSQQLASILFQMNQLLNSNQNNSIGSSIQSNAINVHQQKLNETNNIIKNLLHQQQQQQQQQQIQPSTFFPSNQVTNSWVNKN